MNKVTDYNIIIKAAADRKNRSAAAFIDLSRQGGTPFAKLTEDPAVYARTLSFL